MLADSQAQADPSDSRDPETVKEVPVRQQYCYLQLRFSADDKCLQVPEEMYGIIR